MLLTPSLSQTFNSSAVRQSGMADTIARVLMRDAFDVFQLKKVAFGSTCSLLGGQVPAILRLDSGGLTVRQSIEQHSKRGLPIYRTRKVYMFSSWGLTSEIHRTTVGWGRKAPSSNTLLPVYELKHDPPTITGAQSAFSAILYHENLEYSHAILPSPETQISNRPSI